MMKMKYSPIVLALTLSFFASVGLASIRSFTVNLKSSCDTDPPKYLYITPEYGTGSILAGCTSFMDRTIPYSSSYATWGLSTQVTTPADDTKSCTYTFQVETSSVQKFITLDANTPSNASVHVTTANRTEYSLDGNPYDQCYVKNVCLSTSEGCS